MYDFEETLDTNASPANVWSVLADIRGWPRWSATIESVSFGGAVESGAAGQATVAVGVSARIDFRLEDVVPNKGYTIVWTVGPLLHTRLSLEIEPNAQGSRLHYRYGTGGVMAPFDFLQSASAREDAPGASQRIAQLAGGS